MDLVFYSNLDQWYLKYHKTEPTNKQSTSNERKKKSQFLILSKYFFFNTKTFTCVISCHCWCGTFGASITTQLALQGLCVHCVVWMRVNKENQPPQSHCLKESKSPSEALLKRTTASFAVANTQPSLLVFTARKGKGVINTPESQVMELCTSQLSSPR